MSTVVHDGYMSYTIPLDGECGVVTKVVEHDLPTYTGETVITPSDTEQVLATADKVVARNIVVNPIPENYGRLLYSGNTLTVY
jgi:hypothetical protein